MKNEEIEWNVLDTNTFILINASYIPKLEQIYKCYNLLNHSFVQEKICCVFMHLLEKFAFGFFTTIDFHVCLFIIVADWNMTFIKISNRWMSFH